MIVFNRLMMGLVTFSLLAFTGFSITSAQDTDQDI